MPGRMLAGINLLDTATHTWDIATATGQPAQLPARRRRGSPRCGPCDDLTGDPSRPLRSRSTRACCRGTDRAARRLSRRSRVGRRLPQQLILGRQLRGHAGAPRPSRRELRVRVACAVPGPRRIQIPDELDLPPVLSTRHVDPAAASSSSTPSNAPFTHSRQGSLPHAGNCAEFASASPQLRSNSHSSTANPKDGDRATTRHQHQTVPTGSKDRSGSTPTKPPSTRSSPSGLTSRYCSPSSCAQRWPTSAAASPASTDHRNHRPDTQTFNRRSRYADRRNLTGREALILVQHERHSWNRLTAVRRVSSGPELGERSVGSHDQEPCGVRLVGR